ncbi:MAG: class I adenylate-forming enzyme family protein [Balneolales bacterium]
MDTSETSRSKDRIFLQSETTTCTYDDLSRFTLQLKSWLDRHWPYLSKPRIALEAESSDDLFLFTAACWNLSIPVVPLDVTFISRSKIDRVDPGLFFGRTRTALDKFDSLNVPALTYDSIKAGEPASPEEPQPASGEDIFAWLFTSGSSGRAKLVPCRRRQIIHAASRSAPLLCPEPGRLWLHCLPLNHTGGMSIIHRSLLYGTGIYRSDTFNPERIARQISGNERIHTVSLVPTMLKRLLERDDFRPHPGLKAILLGGGPVQDVILDEAIDRGFPVVTSYGMTETCGAIAAEKYDKAKGAKAGPLLEGNELQVTGKDGRTLPAGKSGYILLKGPQVFSGYADEVNNRESFDQDGWFHTGDFGSVDREGRLDIEPRRTDMIITGGENVSPYEVEALLNRLPGVRESAVAGVPDGKWGEKIVALIVFDVPELEDTRQIAAALRQLLPSYKIPKQFHTVETLPKTSLGKLERGKIREMAEKAGRAR